MDALLSGWARGQVIERDRQALLEQYRGHRPGRGLYAGKRANRVETGGIDGAGARNSLEGASAFRNPESPLTPCCTPRAAVGVDGMALFLRNETSMKNPVSKRQVSVVALVASLLFLWAVVVVPGGPPWPGLASLTALFVLLGATATLLQGARLTAVLDRVRHAEAKTPPPPELGPGR